MTGRRLAVCAVVALLCAACDGNEGAAGTATPRPGQAATAVPDTSGAERYGPPSRLGNVADPAVGESSGLVASRRRPGVYWTHNDSGGRPALYCLTSTGASCGTWDVSGAEARDWEDIAAGPAPAATGSEGSDGAGGRPHIYIGDIGDNTRQLAEVVVYRVPEPEPDPGPVLEGGGRRSTEPAVALRLAYPDGPHDAEALMVHPQTGDIYIVTKEPEPVVYKGTAPLDPSRTTRLTEVATLTVGEGLGRFDAVTAGDIAPDGRRVAVCTYVSGYELVLPEGDAPFDAIWAVRPRPVDLGLRPQGEALAYRADGRALLTTAEGPGSALTQVERQ